MDLQIRLFDHLQLTGRDCESSPAIRPRAQRLLVFLLLHRRRPLTREQIAFSLWPDSPEDRALGALRRALSDLRSGLAIFGDAEWLLVTDASLRWNGDAHYWLDVEAFEQATRLATSLALHQAIELYAGDLLAGWDDDWIAAERDRLRQFQIDALRRLVAHHRALGENEIALSLARRALLHDPLAESAHRDLIGLLYLAGDRAAALTAYDQLRALLDDELGVEPMPETQSLRSAIVQGMPLVPDPAPAAALSRSGGPALPALVGRDAEMETLAALWRSAEAGQGQLVSVSGEAGIGKSRLVRGLVEHANARGGLALIGHCYEFEQALPYQAMVEMLRSAAPLLRHSNLPAAHRRALARLAPDVLGVSGSPGTDVDLPAVDPRAQLFEALWQAFLALARGQPLLLVIEDVHWAATSTIDWLTYIAPRLDGASVLVAITFRTGEVDAGHPLARLNRRLARVGSITTLSLTPLKAEAHQELIRRLSGLPDSVADPLAERLFRETAGNPFFLHELVRGLVETGRLVVHQGRWDGEFIDAAPNAPVPLPETLRDLITGRMERLDPASRTFIQAASVAGRVFPYDIVQRATGWGDEPALSALEDVLAHGFIGQHGNHEGFAFSHHLVQEVIYSGITAPRRVYWHHRLADAIETLHPGDVEALAHHYSRAGDDDRARAYYLQAGDRANRLAALNDAAGYYRAALDRWPESDPAGCAELLYKRAQCQWVLGELHAALGSLRESSALFETLGNRLQVGDVERMIGRVHWEQSDRQASLHHYQRALSILEQEGESVELARAISSISQMHMLAAKFDEAIAWGERALDLAERLEAEDVAIHAQHNIGAAIVSLGDSERGMAMLRDSLQRALSAALPHEAMRTYLSLAEQDLSLGHYAEAGEGYDALLAYARRVHSDFFTGIALRAIVQVNWFIGQWAEALAYREQLVGWLRLSPGSHLGTVWAGRVLGMVHNDLGQASLARQVLERDLATARSAAELQTTVPHLAELARAHAALGDDAGADALFHELLGWVDGSSPVVFDAILPVLVTCHWFATRPDSPDLDALQACVEWLRRAADKLDTNESRAALTEAAGMVLLADRAPLQAAEKLHQAAEGWNALGRPYELAHALGSLANALRLADQVSAAATALVRAVAIYDALAAQLPDPELRQSFLNSPWIRESGAAHSRLLARPDADPSSARLDIP